MLKIALTFVNSLNFVDSFFNQGGDLLQYERSIAAMLLGPNKREKKLSKMVFWDLF